jgi:hypothetical protein
MKLLQNRLLGIGLGLALLSSFAVAGENTPKRTKRLQEKVDIKVVAWGPNQALVDQAKARVEESAAVQNVLKNTKYRLVSFDYIENNGDKSKLTAPPTRFQIVFYDYTNDRTFVAESNFAGTEAVAIREENFEPGVGNEEFKDALEIIKKDVKLGALYKQNKLNFYEAMPPVSNLNGERLVNVGVKFLPDGENQVVGVSFKKEKVINYVGNAPLTSKAASEACGIAPSGQESTDSGVAGQYQVMISQNGSTLWEMLVVRPSASSGSVERSGIEIRDVKYKGKSVLKRGHAPVLTVQYPEGNCGPFRDWQYGEGFFNAPATGAINPAPGIRILAEGQTAQTALDSGNDTGNFQGVAIYTQNTDFGKEIVMVSEMQAGWYRYIMEWRFASDGTIRPRYGFGAVNNPCVCAVHNHHIYWRFDFDIVNPINKIFQIERGRKFLQPIINEAARLRNYQTNRGFLIQNSTGNEAYAIVPNISDGATDSFGGGDFWLLRYKAGSGGEPDEIDDPNPDTSSAVKLEPWVNNESLVNQDIVVWYGAHFIHDEHGSNLLSPDRSGDILTNSHVVGPELRPIRW